MSRRKLYLQAVSDGEEAVVEVQSDVSKVFGVNAAGPSTYINLYDQYTHLLDGSTCTAVHDFITNCGILKVRREKGGREREGGREIEGGKRERDAECHNLHPQLHVHFWLTSCHVSL